MGDASMRMLYWHILAEGIGLLTDNELWRPDVR